MKKFVWTIVILMVIVASFAGCFAEGHRYETDERVSYQVIIPMNGNVVEYIELGDAFTFEIDHDDDGRASLIIWRHVEGEDAEWLNYFCTGNMGMEQSTYSVGLRQIIDENLDFCLDVMDRHGW